MFGEGGIRSPAWLCGCGFTEGRGATGTGDRDMGTTCASPRGSESHPAVPADAALPALRTAAGVASAFRSPAKRTLAAGWRAGVTASREWATPGDALGERSSLPATVNAVSVDPGLAWWAPCTAVAIPTGGEGLIRTPHPARRSCGTWRRNLLRRLDGDGVSFWTSAELTVARSWRSHEIQPSSRG